MATFTGTGDFYRNVMKALTENGGPYKALRLDVLADTIEPVTADGSHRWRVLDKIRAAITAEDNGLLDNPFEIISAREQAGYGFPETVKDDDGNEKAVFPKEKMGERPGTRKRTRKAAKAVSEASGTTEAPVGQVNYWPIIAVKDPARASMRSDLGVIADKLLVLIREQFGNRFDVVLGSKSLTVKFAGVAQDEDEDESVDG
jgi:hypothetical protein